MKTLEEKKLLLQMMRAFGQEDKDLAEQIKREEEFAKLLFKEETVEEKVEEILVEVVQPAPIEELPPQPAKPAETNLQPPEEYKVNQVTNYLDTVSNTKKPPLVAALQDNEFQALRKTVLDLLQKVNTLSWGGGGTGAVRIFDQDDFDRNSVGNGKYMKWQDGWFVMDEINPFEVVHNTTLVTSNTYVVTDSDYYIGVNVNERSTIILPSDPDSGRMVIIKDESGNAQLYPIKIDGNIDNDPGGAEIRINNGGVQLIYRNGWRIV
jgi:hypothetical protein